MQEGGANKSQPAAAIEERKEEAKKKAGKKKKKRKEEVAAAPPPPPPPPPPEPPVAPPLVEAVAAAAAPEEAAAPAAAPPAEAAPEAKAAAAAVEEAAAAVEEAAAAVEEAAAAAADSEEEEISVTREESEIATMVKIVGNLAEFNVQLDTAGGNLIVVDFSATWCGPCKMIKPFYHSMSEKYPDVIFIEIDVDDAQDVASHCDVKCMPTFQFYKNSEKVHEFSGANKEKLEEAIKKYM
ncbi:thioredoxin domain-containing protein 2-like [Erythrolamprus reginae]|uniref:thioredoxin domain-containing protein 2-like n=1 Tax=Erythrolamprus reginae TaxID=121349 RepID=UPI00396C5753